MVVSSASQLHRRGNHGGFGLTNAMNKSQSLHRPRRQIVQAALGQGKHLLRHCRGVLSGWASAQKNDQQFLIGQHAHPLLGGPLSLVLHSTSPTQKSPLTVQEAFNFVSATLWSIRGLRHACIKL